MNNAGQRQEINFKMVGLWLVGLITSSPGYLALPNGPPPGLAIQPRFAPQGSMDCPVLTPEEVLGAPPGCDIKTYEGCNGFVSEKFYYTVGKSYIVCDLAYICVLVDEHYMEESWDVVESQIEQAALLDKTCSGFDLNGQIVGKEGSAHHWLYCAQKDNCLESGSNGFFNCGTKTIEGPNNITFENMVKFYAEEVSNGQISFGSVVNLVDVPLTCSWDTGVYRSAPMAFDDSAITIRLVNDFSNTGEFKVYLRLFKDSLFGEHYSVPPRLSLEDNLFVGAGLKDTKLAMDAMKMSGLVPKIKHLWVSTFRDPNEMSDSVILVSNFCNQLDNIDILSNGATNTAKIKTPIVAYVENSTGKCRKNFNDCRVYIHAYVELSDQGSDKMCPIDGFAEQEELKINVVEDILENNPIKQYKGGDVKDRSKRDVSFDGDTKKINSMLRGIDGLLSVGPFMIDPKEYSDSYKVLIKEDEQLENVKRTENSPDNPNLTSEIYYTITSKLPVLIIVAFVVMLLLGLLIVCCWIKCCGGKKRSERSPDILGK